MTRVYFWDALLPPGADPDAALDSALLAEPLDLGVPSTIRVTPPFDLFYAAKPGYTRYEVAAVFGVMAACPHHRFVIRTAYEDGRAEWIDWAWGHMQLAELLVENAARGLGARFDDGLDALVANYVNGWSQPAGAVDDGNPLNGTVRRWPLPNVRIEVVL